MKGTIWSVFTLGTLGLSDAFPLGRQWGLFLFTVVTSPLSEVMSCLQTMADPTALILQESALGLHHTRSPRCTPLIWGLRAQPSVAAHRPSPPASPGPWTNSALHVDGLCRRSQPRPDASSRQFPVPTPSPALWLWAQRHHGTFAECFCPGDWPTPHIWVPPPPRARVKHQPMHHGRLGIGQTFRLTPTTGAWPGTSARRSRAPQSDAGQCGPMGVWEDTEGWWPRPWKGPQGLKGMSQALRKA